MKAKFLPLLLIAAALVVTQGALAKGPPQKVTISGGDLEEMIEITDDEATLTALGTMYLEDYRTISDEAPDDINGDGYLITRYFEDSMSTRLQYVAFDEVRYFPDPEGGRGYLNYIGIVNGSSEYDGKWFRANSESEAVLVSVIDGEEAVPETRAQSSLFDAFFQEFAVFLASPQ